MKSLQGGRPDFMIVCATFYVLDFHLRKPPYSFSKYLGWSSINKVICDYHTLKRDGLILFLMNSMQHLSLDADMKLVITKTAIFRTRIVYQGKYRGNRGNTRNICEGEQFT